VPGQSAWQNVLSGPRRDARPDALDRIRSSLCVASGLIADRLQLDNAILQHGVTGDRCSRVVALPLTFDFERKIAVGDRDEARRIAASMAKL
jgi:hypothetical protein